MAMAAQRFCLLPILLFLVAASAARDLDDASTLPATAAENKPPEPAAAYYGAIGPGIPSGGFYGGGGDIPGNAGGQGYGGIPVGGFGGGARGTAAAAGTRTAAWRCRRRCARRRGRATGRR
ncbi:unnamed protein product [Urochloa humidicola]